MTEQLPQKSKRGFAAMDPEKRRKIASKGGKSVPGEKRGFAKDPELAAQAGRIGGKSVAAEKRPFSTDRMLAMSAARKGGLATREIMNSRRGSPQPLGATEPDQ